MKLSALALSSFSVVLWLPILSSCGFDSDQITGVRRSAFGVNQTPTIQSIGPQSVKSGEPLSFFVAASDPDGDQLTYTIDPTQYSVHATIDSATGHFSYTAPEEVRRVIFTLTLRVTDNGNPPKTATQSIQVHVTEAGISIGRIYYNENQLSFDETSDFLEVPHSGEYLTDEGTISLWFNASAVNRRQGLWSKDSSGYDSGGHFTLYVESNGQVKVRIQSLNTSHYLQTEPVSANTWHHVAVQFGAEGFRLFLDGVERDSSDYTGGLGPSSGGDGNFEPISIGAATWHSGDRVTTGAIDFFAGSIERVSVYNRYLPVGMVLTLASE